MRFKLSILSRIENKIESDRVIVFLLQPKNNLIHETYKGIDKRFQG